MKQEKKWIVHLNGERYPVKGDCDGHLKLWVGHEDGTQVHATEMGLDISNEWGDLFTTEGIEKEYQDSKQKQ